MAASALKAVLRPAQVAWGLVRGGRARHAALARLRALRAGLRWARRASALRGRGTGPVVLVGLVEHLGDIVAAEPIARHLRAEHPRAHLVWAVRPGYRELIASHPQIDEVLELGCLSEWIHLPKHAFERVVDLHLPGRVCPVCNIKVKKITGDPAITVKTYYHHGNLLEAFCRTTDLPVLRDAPRLRVPGDAAAKVDALRLPEAYVVVHCTSNQAERDWRPEAWRELVEAIEARHGAPVVEVGLKAVVTGQTEKDAPVNLCGQLSILETAEVIRRARLFIGIDSGPAHLANAVGTPGVILLGRFAGFHYHTPYSGGYADGTLATLLHAEGPASSLPVERVLEAVAARLRLAAAMSPDVA